MTKTDLIFPAFSSRFVDFAVQFCFRCKFIQRGAALESGLTVATVARFFSTNHNSLLRIAANEIASFWIDRSRQMAFFVQRREKAGQKAGFRVMLKYFEIKRAFRYYIKQIDSMLPYVWFSNRSQKTSKCGKNISDTLGYASCATFLFLPHFDVICDLLLNRRTATWNLFVNFTITTEIHARSLANFYCQYADRHINLKFMRRVSEREREQAIRQFL